jgi:hypothetical protein
MKNKDYQLTRIRNKTETLAVFRDILFSVDKTVIQEIHDITKSTGFVTINPI